MCTAFIHKGKDIIFGFNMDINVGAIAYDVYATDEWFCIGCGAELDAFSGEGKSVPPFYRVTDGIRKIHGVNSRGVFANCLNNMNFHKAAFRLAEDACSLDQIADDLISGRRSLEEVQRFAEKTELVTIPSFAVNVPNPGFHSLCGDASGRILLLEPGNGYAVLKGQYAAMTNFPVLEPPLDLTDETCGYYGKDRYDTVMRMLKEAGDDLSAEYALKILQATKQTGHWATRVSFVYSCNEKLVRYCLEGDFDRVKIHRFQ